MEAAHPGARPADSASGRQIRPANPNWGGCANVNQCSGELIESIGILRNGGAALSELAPKAPAGQPGRQINTVQCQGCRAGSYSTAPLASRQEDLCHHDAAFTQPVSPCVRPPVRLALQPDRLGGWPVVSPVLPLDGQCARAGERVSLGWSTTISRQFGSGLSGERDPKS